MTPQEAHERRKRILNQVSEAAFAAGYTANEIKAGTEFHNRKNRLENPPGHFDKAGRFFASERSESVRTCRQPTRSFPYSEMHAARTAAHCAEVFEAEEPLHVKRFDKACERLKELPTESAHDAIFVSRELKRILKVRRRTRQGFTECPDLFLSRDRDPDGQLDIAAGTLAQAVICHDLFVCLLHCLLPFTSLDNRTPTAWAPGIGADFRAARKSMVGFCLSDMRDSLSSHHM